MFDKSFKDFVQPLEQFAQKKMKPLFPSGVQNKEEDCV